MALHRSRQSSEYAVLRHLPHSTFTITSAVALSAALFASLLASPLGAQQDRERTLFTWTGTIDREVVLYIRGRDVQTRASGLDAQYAPRLDVREAMPRNTGEVFVHVANGRGDADVLEQPSARNDYTATVRITDPRAGADNYRVVASWRAFGGRGTDGWDDRNRGRDDDRWDDRNRGRDDDRWDDDRNRGRNDRWDRWGRNGRRDGGIIRWRGDIDDVSEIRISGRRVEYRTRSGAPVRNAQYDMRGNGLPRRDVSVNVDTFRGRGRVEVVQQPSRYNGYTAIIRVVDPRSGYGAYDFDILW